MMIDRDVPEKRYEKEVSYILILSLLLFSKHVFGYGIPIVEALKRLSNDTNNNYIRV